MYPAYFRRPAPMALAVATWCWSSMALVLLGSMCLSCRIANGDEVTSTLEATQRSDPAVSADQAIQRSLDYLADRGQWWIDENDCASCHRVGNMLWTLAVAKKAEIEVDPRYDEWQEWTFESLMIEDEGELIAAKNYEGTAQVLIANQLDTFLESGQQAKLVDVLLGGQREDGRWAPRGQLPQQKRPVEETTDVSTAWIALAMTVADVPDAGSGSIQLEKATQALSERQDALSTEWFAVMLHLAIELEQEERMLEFSQRLIELQHADGGWGWLHKDPSDALGTGLAMSALVQANKHGVETSTREQIAEAVRNAEQFLLRTQQPKGSWLVKGTKRKKKDRHEETAEYWGTAWATLALLQAQDDSSAELESTKEGS